MSKLESIFNSGLISSLIFILAMLFLALHGIIPFESFGMYSTAWNNFYDSWSFTAAFNFWF